VAEARNLGDNAAYQVEKAVKEQGDKLPAETSTSLTTKIQELRTALTGEDVTLIRKLTRNCNNSTRRSCRLLLNPALKSAAQTPPESGNPSQGKGSSPEVMWWKVSSPKISDSIDYRIRPRRGNILSGVFFPGCRSSHPLWDEYHPDAR